jgi:hypothetical protein
MSTGIKTPSPQDFVNLLKFGFALPIPPTLQPLTISLDAMIAEAAYYRAEKRNFGPGQEMNDWLEAKKEIIRMVYGDKKAQKRTIKKVQRNYFDWFYFPLHLNFRH